VTAMPHSADPRAGRLASGPPAAGYAAEQPLDWVRALGGSGREQDEALAQLHALMLRAARHQMSRMRSMVPGGRARVCDDIANAAADEAMTALLSKLETFEGRSRFTTWAYKFAILEASVALRRHAWQGREIPLEHDAWGALRDPGVSPGERAQANELLLALREGIDAGLTPHQRRVLVAVTLDDVPIDVLAERLGTTRGALYKTLHDARRRLRERLAARGFDVSAIGGEGRS
jgi:RNA polymerase sigma-70 factor, ECF subfamily